MKNIKKLVICLVWGSLALPFSYAIAQSSKAQNPFTIIRKQIMPSTVPVNQNAVGSYSITNNLPINLSVSVILPPFITQRMGMGACNFPASLKPNETCQFILVFNAPQAGDTFNDANAKLVLFGETTYPMPAPNNVTTAVNSAR